MRETEQDSATRATKAREKDGAEKRWRGKKMTREKMAVASGGQTLICAKNDKHANYSQLVDKIFMWVLIG